VSPRRSRRRDDRPEQLILPPASSPKPAKPRAAPTPEQSAKAYITKRAKPSVVPGHVKLTLTLGLTRELAERLSELVLQQASPTSS